MHILFWGTYDTGKPRTRILREGLRRNGVQISEIHAAIWEGIEDKSQVSGAGRRVALLLRWIGSYPSLLWRFIRAPRPDVVLVGFPGILDIVLLAPFARLRRIPIVWDVFMSLYDTVVVDRRMLSARRPFARLLRWLEGFALRRADLAFLDTEAHARRIESLFALPAGRCGSVWVGVEVEHFAPGAGAARARPPGQSLRVLFYGQFIPLHGIETIIGAARLLRDEPIDWTLIGRGQEGGRIRAMLAEEPLPKVRWIEWVDYAELGRWLAEADLCLGIFGTSEKAASVIPNKVFQIVAAGRPLVTRDSPAIRELLAPEFPCVQLVPPGDAAALAEAIRVLIRPEESLRLGARFCHAWLRRKIDEDAVAAMFLSVVRSRLADTRARP